MDISQGDYGLPFCMAVWLYRFSVILFFAGCILQRRGYIEWRLNELNAAFLFVFFINSKCFRKKDIIFVANAIRQSLTSKKKQK